MAFVSFLRLWDIDNFTDEDWQKDGDFDCLATQAIQVACKEISELQKHSKHLQLTDEDFVRNKLLSIIPKAVANSSHNEWFAMYECRIFLMLNQNKKARDFAIDLIRKKPNEFWTWTLLATVALADNNKKEALICYLKAADCQGDELYKKNVHLELARIFFYNKQFSEAKGEVAKLTKSSEGKKLPDDILAFNGCHEYTEANERDNSILYKQSRQQTDELIYSNIPTISAICGKCFSIKTKDGNIKQKMKIYFKRSILLGWESCS